MLIKCNIISSLYLGLKIRFHSSCIYYSANIYGFKLFQHIPKQENDDETLVLVKTESLESVKDADDAELIEECYNYGEDYVKQKIHKSKREWMKEVVATSINLSCGEYTDYVFLGKIVFITCTYCEQI